MRWAGDISGPPAAVSVKKLLGRKLNIVAPTTGQFLRLGWHAVDATNPVDHIAGDQRIW